MPAVSSEERGLTGGLCREHSSRSRLLLAMLLLLKTSCPFFFLVTHNIDYLEHEDVSKE